MNAEEIMTHSEPELREQLQIADVAKYLSRAATLCHARNMKWWQNPATGEPIQRNVGELLMLCVSELAEAMEAHRKGLNDDKLPHRPGIEVEVVDCMIRLFDLSGALALDIEGAFVEKMEFNRTRADHRHEERLKVGGKAY